VSRFKLMDEASRVITSRGTVIKTMTDGRAEVLFASGAVSQLVQNSTLVPCNAHSRNESPTRAASPNKGGRETPSKKRECGATYVSIICLDFTTDVGNVKFY